MEYRNETGVCANARRPQFFCFDRYADVFSSFGIVVRSIGTKALITVNPVVNNKLIIDACDW
jgi:hypothetical protein